MIHLMDPMWRLTTVSMTAHRLHLAVRALEKVKKNISKLSPQRQQGRFANASC